MASLTLRCLVTLGALKLARFTLPRSTKIHIGILRNGSFLIVAKVPSVDPVEAVERTVWRTSSSLQVFSLGNFYINNERNGNLSALKSGRVIFNGWQFAFKGADNVISLGKESSCSTLQKAPLKREKITVICQGFSMKTELFVSLRWMVRVSAIAIFR